MSTLKLSSDTLGGSVTLAAPTTASNVTVTLPTTAGALATGDATSTITTYPTTAALPAALTGVARVGTDLYVGDGVNTKQQNQTLLPADVVVIGDSTMAAQFDTDYFGLNWNNAFGDGFLTIFVNYRNGAHRVRGCAYGGYDIPAWLDSPGGAGLVSLKAMSPVPKLAFVCFGANDFYLNSLPAKTVLANMNTVLKELNALGIKAIILNGYPRDKYTDVGPANVWSLPKQIEQWSYLAALPELIANYPQHILIDTYSIASDNQTITGNLGSGFMTDGLHPNFTYAKAIADKINILLPPSESLFSSKMASLNDFGGYSKNKMVNGCFAGQSLGVFTPSGAFSNSSLNKCTATHELVAGNTYLGFPYTTLKTTITFDATCTIISNGEYSFQIQELCRVTNFPWKTSVKSQILSSSAGIVGRYVRGLQTDGTTDKYSAGGVLQHGYPTTTANGALAATSMIIGISYIITVTGTTNWGSLGASATTVGTVFTYNGSAKTGSAGMCLPSINGLGNIPIESTPQNITTAEGNIHATSTSGNIRLAIVSVSSGTVVILSSEYCMWQYPSPILN